VLLTRDESTKRECEQKWHPRFHVERPSLKLIDKKKYSLPDYFGFSEPVVKFVVGQFEFALKGHGFSRAVTAAKSIAALAAGETRLSN
jgi:hypothetical protein